MSHIEIVAEMGASHCQSARFAMGVAAAAKSSGADALKLQTWTPGTMVVGANAQHTTVGPWEDTPLADLYDQALLPWDAQASVVAYCQQINLPWFASVFDTNSLEFLESMGCTRYKIASFEITDLELIKAVARTGKPIILSTGAATREEIVDAVMAARDQKENVDLTLLHCVSQYPAPVERMNLVRIKELQRYAKKVGLSDHSLGSVAATTAVGLGATMVEKHIQLGVCDQRENLDAAFALMPNAFARFADDVKAASMAIGNREIGSDNQNAAGLKRSLWFCEDVAEGEIIEARHIVTARPGGGIAPKKAHWIVGQRTSRNVKAGEAVRWDCLDPAIIARRISAAEVS